MTKKNKPESVSGAFPQSLRAEEFVGLYKDMVKVREFEDKVQSSFLEGLVEGTTHLCRGQEAVSVGVLKSLLKDDYLTYTYRGHGVCVARGMDMGAAFAEIFGRDTGVSKGLGGSMHLTDKRLNLIGSFGIIGAGLPVAIGAGLAGQLNGTGQVSATFFGDGAANIGAFHESLNMASVWKLPVLFVCENNLYGEFSHISHTTPYESLVERGASYRMPSISVDGNDVLAVYQAARTAIERSRSGEGPTFLECRTYRHFGHSRTDPAKYRPEGELEEWKKRDPLSTFAKRLLEKNLLQQGELEQISEDIRKEVFAAAKTATEAPWPEPRDYAMETYVTP
ncbi:MAG: thiamine pyrophosphate-dependent dehydrogenase E1 component subunit alpha [Candidatus Berkelbacteria bacterium]|nr:thiamine pyrophosphate-dependent dehydrogenase E1 component subunit alpha [Candidatus Berkelbacteria bacterium]